MKFLNEQLPETRWTKNAVSVLSSSSVDKQMVHQRLIQSIPPMVPVIRNIAVKVNLPEDKTKAIISKIFSATASDRAAIETNQQ